MVSTESTSADESVDSAAATARRGRRRSSPPQLGQAASIADVHAGQNVHSQLHTNASPSGVNAPPQRSQAVLISNAIVVRPSSEGSQRLSTPVSLPIAVRIAAAKRWAAVGWRSRKSEGSSISSSISRKRPSTSQPSTRA